MKRLMRLVSALLSLCLVLTGCSGWSAPNLVSPRSYVYPAEYSSLADPELVDELEEGVYDSLVSELDSDEYLVEEVEAAYVSQEHIDELSFNSRDNVFFGYSLEDVVGHFGDTPYVFTAEDGRTVVKEFESYDDTWDQVARNVAMGTGVIVVLVTVSAVAPAAGAPAAVTAIFTCAAKGAVAGAAIEAPVSGALAGIMTGVEKGDADEAIKSAALAASEGYRSGAIIGAVTGGLTEAAWLRGASKGGITMSEAATVQKESGYPLDVIRGMRNMDEYEVYRRAGLEPCTVSTPQGKRTVLARELDLKRVDESGRTNLQRMEGGLAPKDADGYSYELHHIGQKNDGALALLTRKEHDSEGLHLRQQSEIERPLFDTERSIIYKYLARCYSEAA